MALHGAAAEGRETQEHKRRRGAVARIRRARFAAIVRYRSSTSACARPSLQGHHGPSSTTRSCGSGDGCLREMRATVASFDVVRARRLQHVGR